MRERQPAQTDIRFMRAALELASPVLGRTSPNPAVGCIIVRNGRVVGRGATGPGGRPHAETVALDKAGSRARGATAYVTFEPCAHRGQTPPCARALVAAGIARAVVGCLDPYPPVRGRGLTIMRRAGVAVTAGVLEEECRRLNEGFITRVTRGRPLVLLKLAMTLDGRIAAPGGDSRWISSAPSRELVHRWRGECDAVLVGAGTVIADNPRLTVRLPGGRDPIRVILDGRLRVPPTARVFRQRSPAGALLFTTAANAARARRRYASGRVEVIGVQGRAGEISLGAVMRELGRRGLCRVLIEGGALTGGSALREGVVDRLAIFVAPRILGGGRPAVEGLKFREMRKALRIVWNGARAVGDDWLLEATVKARN